ncbi:transcriptional regulator [Amycolatopsis sp. NPDC003865]
MALVLLSGLSAGLPWALAWFIGWPLPDHVPTAAELGAVLMAPPSTSLLLDVLACGAWLLWGAFILELAGCLRDLVLAAGKPDLARHGSPLRRVAAVLITAIVVSFISRTAIAAPGGGSAARTGVSAVIAVPSAVEGVPEDVELVRAPRDGVHDSLYRIAQRRLGDGDRWPEIWCLNAMSAQPGGRTLTSPSMIHPGERIRLPATSRPVQLKPPQVQPPPREPATGSPSMLVTPSATAPSTRSSWEPEVFIGLGLASAVGAALLLARRRQRAGYRPGSGRRDDLSIAPVVFQLHRAHQHAQAGLEEAESGDADVDGADLGITPELGSPDDEASAELALNLAAAHGLGLIGPGSHAAARALLLTVMTSTPRAEVVAPVADLQALLGIPDNPDELLDGVHIVDGVAAALAHIGSQNPPENARRILLAKAPAGEEDRSCLEQVLVEGCASTTLLLLGQWHPGVTLYIDAAGAITATSPGPGEPLRGRRAFTLPESATRELFALFDAAHSPRDESPSADTHRLEVAGSSSLDQTEAPAEPVAMPAADVRHNLATPLVLSVFGQPRLCWRSDVARSDDTVEVTGKLSPRLWELLIYLALHPEGVPRAAITDTLWAGRPAQDPAAVLRTVLSRLRSTIEKATYSDIGNLAVAEHGRYRLAPAVVEVDYWTFADALARRRRTADQKQRAAAHAAIVAGYGGELAAGFEAEWLTPIRESVRRDALDAVAALARDRVQSDPESTLELLESARDFDPHNELLYRDIMRLEHKLGRHDAIARTLRLLEARLAEIDETPTAATVELAERLRRLHDGVVDAEV